MYKLKITTSLLALTLLVGCSSGETKNEGANKKAETALISNPENGLYWGDTHLHTANSPDAFAFGCRLGFEDAYRFAKGEVIEIDGNKVQLETPLDFLVVADHAEGFGVVNELVKGNPALLVDSMTRTWNKLLNGTKAEQTSVGKAMPEAMDKGLLPKVFMDPKIMGPIMTSIWGNYLNVVDRFYEPGKFTTLAGFEWSSMPNGNNLHRVVVFRDDKDRTSKTLPFSAFFYDKGSKRHKRRQFGQNPSRQRLDKRRQNI